MTIKKDTTKLLGALGAAIGAAFLLTYVIGTISPGIFNSTGTPGTSYQSGAVIDTTSSCSGAGSGEFLGCYYNGDKFNTFVMKPSITTQEIFKSKRI